MIDYVIRSAGLSRTGLVRSGNEDSMFVDDAKGCWAVFDGMGGHANGALASQEGAAGFARLDLPADFDGAMRAASEELHRGNRRIVALAEEAGGDTMGTTAAVLVLRGQHFAAIWVGDSRAYVYRRGGLFQLSVDHTHVQELIDEGMLSPADAEGHPMAHVLSRALGVSEEIEVDITHDEIESGDRFLLCSDGLTGPLEESEIRAIVATGDPASVVERLVERTYEKGAPDNVTAVLVEVGAARHG
jgi:serine/threonine protein phosphatase PrpC